MAVRNLWSKFFFVADDMKEATIITKLLVLQTRFNAIRLIITDQGTNLRNLDRQGNVKFSDEPLKIFTLLKNAINASAYNQRANWCEAAIKKTKLAMKTLTHNNFKTICKRLKPMCFELLLEHIKSAVETSPLQRSSHRPREK